MDRYVIKRPKGYKVIKARDGSKHIRLPDLKPTCMKCNKVNGNDYYEAMDLVNGEYGYMCKCCADEMGLSEKNGRKKH